MKRQFMRMAAWALLGGLGVAPASAQTIAPFWRLDACPGVTGRSAPPLPQPVARIPAPRTPSAPPPALAAEAQRAVLIYEGANDRWDSATGLQEGLSLGALQWNRDAGTLYDELLRDLPADVVAAAGPSIREGIAAMSLAHRGAAQRAAADAQLQAWRTANPGERLDAGLRPAIRAELKAFAAGPLRPRQQQLLDARMAAAWRMAVAFEEARGRTAPPGLVHLAFFFDLNVFAGRANLWVEHVAAFRAAHPGTEGLLGAVAGWLDRCAGTGVYDANVAPLTAALWRRMAAEGMALDEARADLLAFALLRAQRATGDNRTGLHGIYQARLMHRLGIIVLGQGHVNNSRTPCRFPPQRAC